MYLIIPVIILKNKLQHCGVNCGSAAVEQLQVYSSYSSLNLNFNSTIFFCNINIKELFRISTHIDKRTKSYN